MVPSTKSAPPPPLKSDQRDVSSSMSGIPPNVSTISALVRGDSSVSSEPTPSASSLTMQHLPSRQVDRRSEEHPSPLGGATSEVDEDALVNRITQLWSTHGVRSSEARHSREQLRNLRLELGKELSRYKRLLAQVGRGGKWTPFLRQLKISRATADRYIHCWEVMQEPEGENRVSESVSPPSPDEIAALAKRFGAKLLKTLTTPDLRKRFIEALASAFEQSPSTGV